MSWEKVKEVRLWGVTNQNSNLRTTVGDSSGGVFTRQDNPLRGTQFWDQCLYILQGVSVAGGATGGSYTITIQTDAIPGYTGMPIAQAVIGPLTKKTVVMDNLHRSPASPLPTHIFVNQTSSGGGIWFQCHALAKQYRGTLATQPGKGTAERILQGTMLYGSSSNKQFVGDAGIASSTTFTLGVSGMRMGMGRMRLWDNAMYWVVAGNSLSGTHDVSIIGASLGGKTWTVATTGITQNGNLASAGQKLAIASNFYGQSPNPFQIIWTVVSAGGVSDARIVVMAKSGRGSMAKN